MAKYYQNEDGTFSLKKKKKADKDQIAVATSKYIQNANGTFTLLGNDEGIAPVKDDNTWFKAGAFSDGYQVGDVGKTILGTVGDTGVNILKGVTNLGEGIVDLGMYGASGISKILGADELSQNLKEQAQKSFTDRFYKGAEEAMDEYSILGRRSDEIMQGLGYVGGIIGTAGLGGAAGLGSAGATALTTGTTFASSMGGGMSEAYESGATDEEAVIYGAIAGAGEAISEMIFGGLGKSFKALGIGKGLSAADDMLAQKLSSKFTSQIAKNFVEYGVKAGAEGTEEILSGITSAVGKKLTYMSEEDLGQIIEDEKLLDQFIAGAITSGIAQSGYVPGMRSGSLREANETGRDFVSGLTANEQRVLDKEVETRIAEAEMGGKELSKKERNALYDEVQKELEKGYISIDTIESTLGGDTYSRYQSVTQQEEALRKEIEELENMPREQITVKQGERLNEAREQLKSLEENEKTTLKEQLSLEVDQATGNDTFLRESYNERSRRGQAFEADLSRYDPKMQETIKKAADSGILNNTNRTHEFVDMIAKISADKGVLFDFTNSEKLKESGFALDGKAINGYVKDGSISLNIQSAKALNTVVGHEITHVLEGTELYAELQEAVKAYAETKGEYTGRLDAIQNLYKDVENADFEAELTADLVGDYLFTDEDFVRHLSSNKSLFQKIFDEIKYLYKIATAGSKEAKQLEKVKRAFERAYREDAPGVEGVKFSLMAFEDGRRFVEIDQDQDRFAGHNSNEYPRIAKDIINEKFVGKVIGLDNKMFVNGRGRDEFSNPSKHISGVLYESKMKTAGELDNLLDAGTNFRNEPDGRDGHTHSDVIGGFDYFDTLFKLGDRYYEAVINIKNIKNGKLFKDVTKIKDVTQDIMNSYGKNPKFQFLRTSSTDYSIPQNQEKATENDGSGGNNGNQEINLSLSENAKGTTPVGTYNVYGEDVALEVSTKNNPSQDKVIPYVEPYPDHQKNNWKNSKKIVVYENEAQFRSFVEDAKERKNTGKKLYFGKVKKDVAERVKTELGHDISGFNCALYSDNIKKTFKDHGDQAKEDLRGQRAVEVEDFLEIPAVVANADAIMDGGEYQGQPVIHFKKDGMTVVGVASKGSLDLYPQTLYISKKNRSLAPVTDEQASVYTSKTARSTASNNSIPQSTEKSTGNLSLSRNSSASSLADVDDHLGSDEAPISKSVEQKTIEKILTEEPKTDRQRNKRKWAIFRANVFDKGSVFEDLSLKTGNRELMGKWNYTLYSEARAQNLIGNGDAEAGVKALHDIQAEVENSGHAQEFYDYIYNRHNVDRMNLADRYEKTENKPVFGDDVTSEMSQRTVEAYEEAHPEFVKYAQDVYKYMEYLREQLVENGVIAREKANLWAEMYPHYVPIRREDSTGANIDVPLDTRRTGINAPVKRATGGDSAILPLFDTMAMRTMQTYRATAKNSFGVELKNTLGTELDKSAAGVDEVIDSIGDQEELLQAGKNGRYPTFTVFENGEKVTFEITEDMYDAFRPLSDSSILSKTIPGFGKLSNIHRGLLTEYNPVFMLTNAIKDVQDVLLNSQHTVKTYAKIPEAFKQIKDKGYWYNEYMKNGGEQNSYFDRENNTFKSEANDSALKRMLNKPPFNTISRLNNYIELIPRLSEYIASREDGASVEVAMLDAARVTTNFRAGGDLTKFLNRNGATFLNASVQGAMQQVRNFREANANGIKGWANLAAKFAVAGLPAVLLNALLWDDDEEYAELSDYVKQNYYVVAKTEDGSFIRIPKGRTLAVIQDAFAQIGNVLTGNDEADLAGFLDLVINNLAPNNPLESNVLSPIVQAATNTTWYGGDLVPTRLQNLRAAEQYDESTDAFSKWLGQMTNISPVKINYILDQYSGGIGDVVLPMLTPEAESGDDSLLGNLIAPLKSKFVVDPVMNNQSISDLYDTSDQLTVEANKAYATDEDALMNKYVNSVKGEMSNLYSKKREIQSSDLKQAEKYARVQEIQAQINELAKTALIEFPDVQIDGSYATVGDRQYRLTEEGEWTKITDKQIEKQREVSSALGVTAADYWGNKSEYDYIFDSPGKYAISQAVGGYDAYRSYTSALSEIESDKNASGNTITGSRKRKVVEYINGLDIDYGEKMLLFKSQYTADDTYNTEIVEYLNSRTDISYHAMKEILELLDFTVGEDGTITW